MTTQAAAEALALPVETLHGLYRDMWRIRRFEETALYHSTQGDVYGAVHLYIGEEAVAVGVCAHLRDDDYVASTHRGHGHCIAKGARTDRMMAELFGRETGYCRGKGGSMHIADLALGMLGANGIVGGGIADRRRRRARRPSCAAAATGRRLRSSATAPTNQGTFHEALNLAALWQLPVVFVCENNRLRAVDAARHERPRGGARRRRARPATACPASRSTATTCSPCTTRSAAAVGAGARRRRARRLLEATDLPALGPHACGEPARLPDARRTRSTGGADARPDRAASSTRLRARARRRRASRTASMPQRRRAETGAVAFAASSPEPAKLLRTRSCTDVRPEDAGGTRRPAQLTYARR